jgi:hypothetical protein
MFRRTTSSPFLKPPATFDSKFSLTKMNSSPTHIYLQRSRELADAVEAQAAQIQKAADWFAQTILVGRMVHVFGSGHSRMMVEEMWPRYGSFPGFNPIVELSLSFHNLVVGSNGQRQAMFLENVSGLAERILRNFDLSKLDSALVISSSGGFHRQPKTFGHQHQQTRGRKKTDRLFRSCARHRRAGG